MKLPDYVLSCIQTLEAAGFAAYAVGGCVRDDLLGLAPHDFDLCTQALPSDTQAVFADRKLVLAGEKHGTVAVVTDGGVVEITTWRTEGEYLDNRHPAWVAFVPDIEQDLARRDFTVNAMAYSPTRGYADPFGGREDLNNKILRCVGDPEQRFREDSLRILRGVRFAVKYRLEVEEETLAAMFRLAPLMENLARERIFEELCGLLSYVTVADLKRFAPILAAVIPELSPMIGFNQHSPHHAYDVYTHTAFVVEGVSPDLTRRWAALLHDSGKVPTFTRDKNGRGHFYGHAAKSAEIADAVLRRLKAPTQLRQDVVFLIEKHMTKLEPDKKLLRRRLAQFGWQRVSDLLALQIADFTSKGVMGSAPDFDRVQAMLTQIMEENACLSVKDLAVNGHDLMRLGYSGKEIGQTLNLLLEKVLEEELANDKDALLNFLKQKNKIEREKP